MRVGSKVMHKDFTHAREPGDEAYISAHRGIDHLYLDVHCTHNYDCVVPLRRQQCVVCTLFHPLFVSQALLWC